MQTLDTFIQRENNSFGLVRIFAATMVVVSHAFLLTTGNLEAEPLIASTSYPLGGHAVHMFFALSGYLIAASWNSKPDVYYFLTGRFLRLFPALLIVTISAVVAGIIVAIFLPSTMLPGIREVLLFIVRTVFLLDGGGKLPSVFPLDEVSGSILATVWTLRYEVLCYLTIPLLGLLSYRRQYLFTSYVLVILTLSAAQMIISNSGYHNSTLIDHLARFYFAFYVGVAAWIFRRHLRLSFAIGLLLIAISYLAIQSPISKPVEIITVAYITFWLGSRKFGILARLTNREDVSYGVYLIGYPAQLIVINLLPAGTSVIVNLIVTLAVTVPLAIISWRVIEKPALLYRKKLTQFCYTLVQYRPFRSRGEVPKRAASNSSHNNG